MKMLLGSVRGMGLSVGMATPGQTEHPCRDQFNISGSFASPWVFPLNMSDGTAW